MTERALPPFVVPLALVVSGVLAGGSAGIGLAVLLGERHLDAIEGFMRIFEALKDAFVALGLDDALIDMVMEERVEVAGTAGVGMFVLLTVCAFVFLVLVVPGVNVLVVGSGIGAAAGLVLAGASCWVGPRRERRGGYTVVRWSGGAGALAILAGAIIAPGYGAWAGAALITVGLCVFVPIAVVVALGWLVARALVARVLAR